MTNPFTKKRRAARQQSHLSVSKTVLVASLLTVVPLSACSGSEYARQVDQQHAPRLYNRVFNDVLTRAYLKGQTGQDFYTLLGERAWDPSVPAAWHAPCSNEEALKLLAADPALCSLSKADEPSQDCRNRDGCATLRFDPAFVASAKNVAFLRATLRSPCQTLTDPSSLNSPRDGTLPDKLHLKNLRARGTAYSARETWVLLRCGTNNPVVAQNISIDASTGAVTFKF